MNKTADELKEIVRDQYADIASQDKQSNQSSCCGSGECSTEVYNIMTDDYSELEGHREEADLGLGCGLPTEFAQIKEGDTVIDLGSGAGNDCFVARSVTGESGKVIGIDFTPEMISKARENAGDFGFNNVEFRQGDIEAMPISANRADVIVSNCVLNLVPDKENVFREIFRVLKPGGHFSISDIVLAGSLPPKLKEAAEMYAGCVSGAIQKTTYLKLIEQAEFSNITLQKEKVIKIPDDILSDYLSSDEVKAYHESDAAIYSITVYGEKTAKDANGCQPGSGCC